MSEDFYKEIKDLLGDTQGDTLPRCLGKEIWLRARRQYMIKETIKLLETIKTEYITSNDKELFFDFQDDIQKVIDTLEYWRNKIKLDDNKCIKFELEEGDKLYD